nr:DJ-1/PfpI family protein [Bifidobacterium indicum]
MDMNINILLFEEFEPLDVFGPFEVFFNTPDARTRLFCLDGPQVVCGAGHVPVSAVGPNEIDHHGVLLIPGGDGTRPLSKDRQWLDRLRELSSEAAQVLTVCTGSALLAATGLLDGRRATSNDLAFDWVTSVSDRVTWIRDARWTVDGNFRTSSGISAGIDMALSFIEDIVGPDAADRATTEMEYVRNRDSNFDPFSWPDTH